MELVKIVALGAVMVAGAGIVRGADVPSTAYVPTSLVAQLSIWDHPLSEAEVRRLSAHPPVGDEEGLLGYWPLDAGMDGLFDQVANGNVKHSFTVDAAADTAFVDDPVGWQQFGSCIAIR